MRFLSLSTMRVTAMESVSVAKYGNSSVAMAMGAFLGQEDSNLDSGSR